MRANINLVTRLLFWVLAVTFLCFDLSNQLGTPTTRSGGADLDNCGLGFGVVVVDDKPRLVGDGGRQFTIDLDTDRIFVR